ncbi:protein of unknown function [Stenotrophomonas maltophilia]|nr:protein of unknown function [Stenotrophomonas maltophilia]
MGRSPFAEGTLTLVCRSERERLAIHLARAGGNVNHNVRLQLEHHAAPPARSSSTIASLIGALAPQGSLLSITTCLAALN